MKVHLCAVAALLGLALVSLQSSSAQDQKKEQKKEQKKTIGKIESFDPRFDKLIAKNAEIEQITDDKYLWNEGPVWIKSGGFLLWSEIPNNVIHKWKEGEGVTEWLKPSGYTGKAPRGGKAGDEPGSNGLNVDNQGNLLLCEHGDRQVTRVEIGKDGKPGKKTVLAKDYMGKRFNSPNDVCVAANGDIYFTDPYYGLPEKDRDINAKGSTRELDFCGVYRIAAKDGKLSLVTKELNLPNGVALSPDDKTLYIAVSDDKNPIWMSYPLKEDGTVGTGKVLADAKKSNITGPGVPDGVKVDQQGNLFTGGPGGILVIAPDGTFLGRLRTDDNTANCAFGGDGSTLYIAVNHRMARIPTLTKGRGY